MQHYSIKKAEKGNNGKDSVTKAGGGMRKTAIRFKSLADIRRFMGRILNDLDSNKILEGKARTLGYLCSVLRDVIKDSELEMRVLKIEKELSKNGNNA